MDFAHLFSPIKVNDMMVRNRIVMTAMHLGYTPEGEVTDRLVRFYAERARGGVGLIILGGCPIDEYGGMMGMVGISQAKHICGLQKLTSAVHATGAMIAAQLYQAGRYTHSAMIGGRKPFSASAVRSKLTGETPRALDLPFGKADDTPSPLLSRARSLTTASPLMPRIWCILDFRSIEVYAT